MTWDETEREQREDSGQETEKDDGGSAFPAMLPGGHFCTPGMSLRDWFAGMAMQGLLASDRDMNCESQLAKWAFEQADVMISLREKM